MGTGIKIPKVCHCCGNMFIAQKTTTRYCGHTCASRAYKKRKRDEVVQATLKEQLDNVTSTQSTTSQIQNNQSTHVSSFVSIRDKEFLSIKEAATLLGASRWTIQRMIQREEIKTGKVGRRVIIPRTEINKLFN